MLGDGERGALVGPRGDIAWMCAPQWHGDAVFSSLIGGSGCYAVTPVDPRFVWGGYYEDSSLIWRSRWITTKGVIECHVALAYPADPRTAVLLRRIEARTLQPGCASCWIRGPVSGGTKSTRLNREDAIWTARSGPCTCAGSGGGSASERDDGGLELIVDLAPGAASRPGPGNLRQRPGRRIRWRPRRPGKPPGRLGGHRPGAGRQPGAPESQHSYAVLAGLTNSGGGMVAAATMSLPERVKAGRNYDYRYVWIRDQCYTGQAVAADGPHRLLDDAVDFVASRILDDGPELKPAYTINGGRVPDEHTLSQLAGYPGGSDKSGNWVNQQFQLDALGEALLLFAAAARHDHLDTSHWRAAEAAVGAIKARQSDPDAGVWELDNQRWTHSRLMCVAGLRAIAAAEAASGPAAGRPWPTSSSPMRPTTACTPAAAGSGLAGDQRTDAALLLPAIRGATTAGDPRAVATLEAVESELARDGYLYRFRHDQRPLHEAEGAFVLCGFVMALALQQQGREKEAVGWFERNQAACGPPTACSPRNSTSSSGSCAATYRRPSSMPSCSNPPRASPGPGKSPDRPVTQQRPRKGQRKWTGHQ